MARRRIQFTRNEPCTNPGCPNLVWARGLCSKHYQAEYRTRGPPCAHKGCPKTSFARGLCVRHYQEQYRHQGAPCTRRKCANPSFSRGLCVKHYHRWYQKTLKENGVKSLKALPAEKAVAPRRHRSRKTARRLASR